MSQENVDVVRELVVAIEGGDYDAAAREFRPDAEWHNTAAFPGPTICSGPKEIKTFWKSLFEDFDDGQLEIERTAESGDTVVVLLHSRGRGRTSGAPIDVRWASSFHFTGGKVIRVDVYGDYGKALDAAGIEE